MMSIIKICDPVFQYICLICKDIPNENINYKRVKEDIERLIFQVRGNASAETYELWKNYELIQLPLLCFVDYMLANSSMSFAVEWDKNRLAFAESCYTGDKKFFSQLELLLEDKSDAVNDILIFFYTCIKLGFRGIYETDQSRLDGYLWEIGKKISIKPINNNSEIFPSLYEPTSNNKKLKIASFKKRILLLIVSLLFLYTCLTFILYYDAAESFLDTMHNIKSNSLAYSSEIPASKDNKQLTTYDNTVNQSNATEDNLLLKNEQHQYSKNLMPKPVEEDQSSF